MISFDNQTTFLNADDLAKNREAYHDSVNEILRNFCEGKNIAAATYDAAQLVDLVDLTLLNDGQTKQKIAARNILRKMFSPNSDLNNKNFIEGILYDRQTLWRYWHGKMNDLYGNDAAAELTNLNKNRCVALTVWGTQPQYIHPAEANRELVENIQVESLLIASARTLQNLHQFRNDDELCAGVDAFQNVFQAETLLAPLIELMGFHAFAMALNSDAMLLRLKNSGRTDLINKAENLLRNAGDHESFAASVREMWQELVGDSSGQKMITSYDKVHCTLLGSGKAKIDGRDVRYVWRRKGLGQVAKKIENYNNMRQNNQGYARATPMMDILGGTLIAKDDADVANVFYETVTHALRNKKFNLAPSPARRQAIHVRGNQDFCAAVKAKLAKLEITDAEIDKKNDDRGLNLAKILFYYGDKKIPTEIQVLSEYMRREMLIGQFSHAAYHLNGKDKTINKEDLAAAIKINSRKDKTAEPDLYKPLSDNGRKFHRQLFGHINETVVETCAK